MSERKETSQITTAPDAFADVGVLVDLLATYNKKRHFCGQNRLDAMGFCSIFANATDYENGPDADDVSTDCDVRGEGGIVEFLTELKTAIPETYAVIYDSGYGTPYFWVDAEDDVRLRLPDSWIALSFTDADMREPERWGWYLNAAIDAVNALVRMMNASSRWTYYLDQRQTHRRTYSAQTFSAKFLLYEKDFMADAVENETMYYQPLDKWRALILTAQSRSLLCKNYGSIFTTQFNSYKIDGTASSPASSGSENLIRLNHHEGIAHGGKSNFIQPDYGFISFGTTPYSYQGPLDVYGFEASQAMPYRRAFNWGEEVAATLRMPYADLTKGYPLPHPTPDSWRQEIGESAKKHWTVTYDVNPEMEIEFQFYIRYYWAANPQGGNPYFLTTEEAEEFTANLKFTIDGEEFFADRVPTQPPPEPGTEPPYVSFLHEVDDTEISVTAEVLNVPALLAKHIGKWTVNPRGNTETETKVYRRDVNNVPYLAFTARENAEVLERTHSLLSSLVLSIEMRRSA